MFRTGPKTIRLFDNGKTLTGKAETYGALYDAFTMQDTELDRFKIVLEQSPQDLLITKNTGRDAVSTVTLDQSSAGRVSRMDALQGQAMAIESQRRRTLQLRRIELALGRLASGEFGVCQWCEEDIDPRRLEVDRTATLCIACAIKQDS